MNRSAIPEGLRVLLVDDEADVRRAIGMLLTEVFTCTVVEACDGEDALRLFKTQSFDLVFTDYLMPRLNGCELVKKLREHAPKQAIVMVTAFPNLGGGCEIDALVKKPCNIPDLAEGMNRALEKRRATEPEQPTLSSTLST